MGIIDKVKNSDMAKTAAKKADEFLNDDQNEKHSKGSERSTDKKEVTSEHKSEKEKLNNMRNKG